MSARDIIERVAACTTLWESADALVDGLAAALETGEDPKALASEIRALATQEPRPNGGSRTQLAASLTVGTSHVAVHPADPLVDALRTALEAPLQNRDAHIASIQMALEQPRLDLAQHVVELRGHLKARDAAIGEHREVIEAHATALSDAQMQNAELAARLDTATKALTHARTLLEAAQQAVEAKTMTITALNAHIEALQAKGKSE